MFSILHLPSFSFFLTLVFATPANYRVSVLCRADCRVTGGQYYVELLVRGNDLDLEAPKAIRKSVLCKAA